MLQRGLFPSHKIILWICSKYINCEKVEEAKRLLRDTDAPVSEIAATLAFSSQSCLIFREFTGETPKSYRVKQLVIHR
jgi:AraC-like DNA-binding protein